jgi:3-methyladenine DNA glycosylase AlkD
MSETSIQKQATQLVGKADNPEEFVKELHNILKVNANPKTQASYQRIIPKMGKSFGTPLPVLRTIATELGKCGQKTPRQVLSLLEILWAKGSFEERQIVGKAIERVAKKHPKECLKLTSPLLNDLDNWAVCDNLACFGMEPITIQHTDEVLALCQKWIKSDNKWTRRFAVVTLRAFKKMPTSDKVFKILDEVMQEEEWDVKKAVTWILREITKKNPEAISKFLQEWAKRGSNKHTRWIIKDGMRKLPSNDQQKIRFLLE